MSKRADDDDWDTDPTALALIGTVQPITEYSRRRKVMKRPIGFMRDLDTLVEDDTP